MGRKPKMCEDCRETGAMYGLPDIKQRRWCGPCAKKHGGVRLGKSIAWMQC